MTIQDKYFKDGLKEVSPEADNSRILGIVITKEDD